MTVHKSKPPLPEQYKTEFSIEAAQETVVGGYEGETLETPARPITKKTYQSTGLADIFETPAVGISKSFESTGRPDTSSFETPTDTAREFAEMSTIKFTPEPHREERPWEKAAPPKPKRPKPKKPPIDRLFTSKANKIKKQYAAAMAKGTPKKVADKIVQNFAPIGFVDHSAFWKTLHEPIGTKLSFSVTVPPGKSLRTMTAAEIRKSPEFEIYENVVGATVGEDVLI